MESTKRKRKPSAFKITIILFVAALAVLTISFSPLFRITQIDIFGNSIVANSDILREAELSLGSNMFTFRAGNSASRIADMPYVGRVTITRHLPNRLSISIEERHPAANIRFGTATYLLIDNEGIVIEAGQNPAGNIPRVMGFSFSSFNLGQSLQVEEAAALNDLLTLTSIFSVYDFSPELIDFTNPRAIILHYGDMVVEFGNMIDAERRVSFLVTTLDRLNERYGYNMGFVDVREANEGRIFFRLSQH